MGKKNRQYPWWNDKKTVPYLFILPNMVLFLVFMIVPLLMSFCYSFTRWNGLGSPVFIGLKNYTKLFTDSVFLQSVWNTFRFSLMTVPLLVVMALAFAIFLNQNLRFKGVYRTVLYLPSVVSNVAAGMIFIWLFNPQIGLINYLLTDIGASPVDWTNDVRYAIFMVVTATLWSRIGYNMVIYLAGLQSIPTTYYEAAIVDGASKVQKLWYITLPLLKSSHIFIFITAVIYSFRSFDLIYVMTKGGPLNSTKTLVVYIYDMAFGRNQYGVASAASVVLLLIMMVFTVIRLRNQK
ncbi:MAG: sugar ABC transporter permease [Candidatus Methanomethylophilaceae archaeon]